jgi:hypothetical protein
MPKFMNVECHYIFGGFIMKFNRLLIILLAILGASVIVSAQEIGIDQLKQMIGNSTANLTTYTYSRSAESRILYSNDTIKTGINLVKSTQGKVDLADRSGWWSANLTDKNSGETLTWEAYLVNGSEYWNENGNWTRFNIRNTAQIIDDYNEIPGQVNLIGYSNMKIVGEESFQGEDDYKLVGTPIMPIYRGLIGLQLLTAYVASPFPLPNLLRNRTLNIGSICIINSSSIVLTAWVSKDKYLLRRLDINSSLNITPQTLNISSQNYMIQSTINESTVYSNFGAPVTIELPPQAQNESFRLRAIDWRWAIFGSVRP